MLMATFLTTIFYSSTYPFIHKEIMTVASDSLIAFNQIVNCVSVIIFGYLWNKCGEKLFKHYTLFCVLETMLGIMTTVFVIITHDIVSYYILDLFVFSIVTRNICCGGIRLKALRYKAEGEREKFDNNNNSVSSIATILGSIIAMFLKLDFNTMIVLATFGNIVDNIFYMVIFENEKKNSGL